MQKKGNIADEMMYNTYNMGLGMVLALDPADVDKTLEALKAAGETAYVVGTYWYPAAERICRRSLMLSQRARSPMRRSSVSSATTRR